MDQQDKEQIDPRVLPTVRLTMLLAQGPGFPEGDLSDRMEATVALNGQGGLNIAAFEAHPVPWLATREHPSRGRRQFELVRLDEGWALQSLRSEDDPLWTFNATVCRPGELVVLRRPDGEELIFRIVAADPI